MQTKTYFSTFITGFQEVIEEVLPQQLAQVEIHTLLDGLVLYSTSTSIETVKRLAFFNNTYLLIHYFDSLKKQPLQAMVKHILDHVELKHQLKIRLPRSAKTFRVIFTTANRMVPMSTGLQDKIEQQIADATGLRVHRTKPNIEFWFMHRSEGVGFFGMRITQHPDFTKSLPKGALRPEIAHLMVLLSQPQASDVVLDPFAGFGSIPIAQAVGYPYQKLIATDSNKQLIKRLNTVKKRLKVNFESYQADALLLDEIANNSVSKIVTDPPWGLYDSTFGDITSFYAKMLHSFHRVLMKDGVMVLLINDKKTFEELLYSFRHKFKFQEVYDILVSGKKAAVYVLKSVS